MIAAKIIAIAMIVHAGFFASQFSNNTVSAAGYLCDNGSGACSGGSAGYLLNDVNGKLLAR